MAYEDEYKDETAEGEEDEENKEKEGEATDSYADQAAALNDEYNKQFNNGNNANAQQPAAKNPAQPNPATGTTVPAAAPSVQIPEAYANLSDADVNKLVANYDNINDDQKAIVAALASQKGIQIPSQSSASTASAPKDMGHTIVQGFDQNKEYGRTGQGGYKSNSYNYSYSGKDLQRQINAEIYKHNQAIANGTVKGTAADYITPLKEDGMIGYRTKEAMNALGPEAMKRIGIDPGQINVSDSSSTASGREGADALAAPSRDSATDANAARAEQRDARNATQPTRSNPLADRLKELDNMAANDPNAYMAMAYGLSDPSQPAEPTPPQRGGTFLDDVKAILGIDDKGAPEWSYGSGTNPDDSFQPSGTRGLGGRPAGIVRPAVEPEPTHQSMTGNSMSAALENKQPDRLMPRGYATPANESLAGNSYSEALARAATQPDTNIFRQDLEELQAEIAPDDIQSSGTPLSAEERRSRIPETTTGLTQPSADQEMLAAYEAAMQSADRARGIFANEAEAIQQTREQWQQNQQNALEQQLGPYMKQFQQDYQNYRQQFPNYPDSAIMDMILMNEENNNGRSSYYKWLTANL